MSEDDELLNIRRTLMGLVGRTKDDLSGDNQNEAGGSIVLNIKNLTINCSCGKYGPETPN